MKHVRQLNLTVLLLCLIFTCMCLGVIGIGARQYAETTKVIEHYFNIRIPLQYITRKVQENNEKSGVILTQKEGCQVLVLKRNINQVDYEIWIYEYEGELYELFIESGTEVTLEAGTALVPVKGLKFQQEDCYLKIQLKNEKDEPVEVVLMIRG